VKVFHRDRLPPLLQDFADAWELAGPFDLTVPGTGGNRTDDQQLLLWSKGRTFLPNTKVWVTSDVSKVVTRARSAADSAHGRGAAGDFHPVRSHFANGLPATVWTGAEEDPLERATAVRRFEALGGFAEKAGLEWGGRFPHFDGPHVQLKNWRALPRV